MRQSFLRIITPQQIQAGLEFPERFGLHHTIPPLAIFTANYWEFPARRFKATHLAGLSLICDRQKLTSLNINEQPREDENTELRCVKDSHASWAQITRPMFRNLLAERPVLGQPDQFTKGFYPQISACPLCGVSAGSFAVSGAHLNAAGSSNVHARGINGKTSRQLGHLFSHPLFYRAVSF